VAADVTSLATRNNFSEINSGREAELIP